MEMHIDKRKMEIILAILVLVGLVVLLLALLLPKKEETEEERIVREQVELSEKRKQMPPTTVDAYNRATDPNVIARNFVERFGSFSSDVNYLNVEDVLPLAAASLQNRLQQLANDARSRADGQYYGISTYIIASEEISKTDTSARYELLTQRNESIEHPQNTSVRYQHIDVELIKEGDLWYVNNYQWKE